MMMEMMMEMMMMQYDDDDDDDADDDDGTDVLGTNDQHNFMHIDICKARRLPCNHVCRNVVNQQ